MTYQSNNTTRQIRQVSKLATVLLLGGALLLPGCKKYLEQVPDNRTELNSPEKVSQLLTTAYPDQDYITFCESMSDNAAFRNREANAGAGDNRVNEKPYRFEDFASTQQGAVDEYWRACYKAIASANQALEACNTAANPAAYAPYKGEALIARAYAHFMLVTLFAKAYDPASASADPGIPYMLKPETSLFGKYERKTVAYVYEMIEKDIMEGLPLLDDKAYKVPSFRFNNAAANAFASRFFLFKKQYDKVITYVNRTLPSMNPASSLRQWNTTYSTITYDEWRALYTKTTEKANLLLATTNSIWSRGFLSFKFGMNGSVFTQVFGAGRNPTGGSWAYAVYRYGSGADDLGIFKFIENFVYTSADIGNPYIYVPLLTAEEALLNRAEANVQTDKYDAAIADLNAFVSTRVRGYSAATHNLTQEKVKTYYKVTDVKEALIKTVLDFRRAEFMQEGMRWLDILRHKLPVTHVDEQGVKIELGANDPRKVLQIPQSAQSAGIAANPR